MSGVSHPRQWYLFCTRLPLDNRNDILLKTHSKAFSWNKKFSDFITIYFEDLEIQWDANQSVPWTTKLASWQLSFSSVIPSEGETLRVNRALSTHIFVIRHNIGCDTGWMTQTHAYCHLLRTGVARCGALIKHRYKCRYTCQTSDNQGPDSI